MANTWPLTLGSGSVASGYSTTGATTLRWGTTGLLQSPKRVSGFYVVTNFRQRPIMENIKLTDGFGWTDTRVLLVDGYQWEVTVRDDSGMTAPVEGDTVVITDASGMVAAASQSGDPNIRVKVKTDDPAPSQVFNATVVDPSYNAAPKEPGERVLLLENLIQVETQVKGTPV
jgi:hypothetical protein